MKEIIGYKIAFGDPVTIEEKVIEFSKEGYFINGSMQYHWDREDLCYYYFQSMVKYKSQMDINAEGAI